MDHHLPPRVRTRPYNACGRGLGGVGHGGWGWRRGLGEGRGGDGR